MLVIALFIILSKWVIVLIPDASPSDFVTCSLYSSTVYWDECKGIIVNDVLQNEEVLKAQVTSPYQMAMDYDTNTLFFSYSTGDSDVFRSAYLNLKTNEFGDIPGIAGGFSNTVDNKKNIVYLGGRDGIYEFNYNTKEAQRLNITDHNI